MRKNHLLKFWLITVCFTVFLFPSNTPAFSVKSVQNQSVADSIYVTFPRCYEWFVINQLHDITWEAPSDIAAVKLEYTVDNGTTWEEITSHTPNDGLYSWLVPDQTSARFLVRISNAEDSTKYGISKSPSIIAPDALVNFTEYDRNPVFEPDSAGSWDENLRERGWFMYENGEYFLWYSGWQGEYDKLDSNLVSPGLALSSDGVTWTRVADSALFVEGWVEDVCVVKKDTVYYMYTEDEFDGSDIGAHIDLYMSVNKIDWTHAGTVLSPQGAGWECDDVGTPTVWIEDDIWYMLYEGIGGGTKGQIGLATSPDGINWTRYANNPVLANPLGEHRHIAIDSRIKVAGTTFIYGHYQLEDWRYVGGVFASDDLVNWIAYAGNPITANSPVLVDNGDQYLLYSWDENTGVYNLSYSTPLQLPDTTGSEIYDVIVQNVNATSVEIAWKTRETAPSIIDYGLTTAYGSSDNENTNTTSHFKLLTGLEPNSTYHFRLRSANSLEPEICSVDYTFTTARSTDPLVYIRRVNAAGPAYVKNDQYWHADQPFADGEWGFEESKDIYTTPDSVLGSSHGFIYRSERWGQQAYRFTVPVDGRYRVTLHFAEIWYNANRKRVFDVWLENILAVNDLDIYKTIGHDRALAMVFELQVEDGEMNIDLTNNIEDPKIAGIEVEKIPESQIAVDLHSIEVEDVTPKRINLSWETDILTTSQISYGLYPHLNKMSAEEASPKTEHSVTFKDLQPDTKYAFRIISQNAAGVYTIHAKNHFTTVENGTLAIAHVQHIFDDNCVKCHTGTQPPANLNLETGQAWNNLYDMPAVKAPQWKRVVAGDREASWLFEKITNAHPAVGTQMGRLSDGDIELIGQWIDQGAHREIETPLPLLQILTSELPEGEINLAYAAKINGTGGNPPWHFAISRGALPQGLTLDAETGIIAGVPAERGSFEFKIELIDSFDDPDSTCQEFTININPESIKWQVPAEFQLQTVATDFDRPTSIAFALQSSEETSTPLFYVAERFGTILTVAQDYSKQVYAWNLLNFDPNGNFPDSGHMGLSALCVDPQSGDLFAAAVYDSAGFKLAKIIRFQSQDSGRTAAQQETILSGIAARMSHGINELAFGPDSKLYALVGDNWQPELAEDSDFANGKVLRMNSDGSAPDDNPFSNSIVYAMGLRNPSGLGWNEDGVMYLADRGPDGDDRIVRIEAGKAYGWRHISPDLAHDAIKLWEDAVNPTTMQIVPEEFYFPRAFANRLLLGLGGQTDFFDAGDYSREIRMLQFTSDDSVLVDEPFLTYTGGGQMSIRGLAFGDGGLYFCNYFGENGIDANNNTHANIYKLRWTPADSIPPAITGIEFESITDTAATVLVTVDEPVKAQILFGHAQDSLAVFLPYGDFAEQHRIVFENLAADSNYFYQFTLEDQTGHRTISAAHFFRTRLNNSDTTDITIQIASMSLRSGLVIELEDGTLQLSNGGSVAENVYLPLAGDYRFILHANADSASVAWPELSLFVDGELVSGFEINKTEDDNYVANFSLEPGLHNIAIANTSDTTGAQTLLVIDWLRVDNTNVPLGISEESHLSLPDAFALSQNYPNPFNPETTLDLSLPANGEVTAQLYNVRGQLVSTLFEGPVAAGQKKLVWNGRDGKGETVVSGIYFLRVVYESSTGKTEIAQRRLLLMK